MNENSTVLFHLTDEEKKLLKKATFDFVLSNLRNHNVGFPGDLAALIDFIRIFGNPID